MTKAERELVRFLERRNPGWSVEIEHGTRKLTITVRRGKRPPLKCRAPITTSDNGRNAYNVERKLRTQEKGYF
jgi:hypothetical protein